MPWRPGWIRARRGTREERVSLEVGLARRASRVRATIVGKEDTWHTNAGHPPTPRAKERLKERANLKVPEKDTRLDQRAAIKDPRGKRDGKDILEKAWAAWINGKTKESTRINRRGGSHTTGTGQTVRRTQHHERSED